MKRLGPELKMPELKVPPALADLFYDLHDRRLLPLIALVIVAIVAVPFLLTKSEPRASVPPVSATTSSTGASAARAAKFTVTQVDPGLRVARKRLAKRHAKDPFVQKFTHVAVPAAGGGESAATSTTVTEAPSTSASPPEAPVGVPIESSPPASAPASSPPTGANSGGAAPGPGVVTYTWAIDVKITKTVTNPDGTKEQGKPETRERILPPATLPAKKVQVVAYIGVNPTTEKPLFLISTEVTSVFGEAKCVAGTSTCQLLEMEPKFPETFALGESGVNYKINVLSVKRVAVPQAATSPE